MAERQAAWLVAAVLALSTPWPVAAAPPPVTAAERSAAFPEISPHVMHRHMDEDPLTGMFRADEFEWQDASGDDAIKWDVTGWLGHDMNRLWLRAEGHHVRGDQVENRAELLWGHPLSAWWDGVAGLRHDTGPGPSRTYVAAGVQGLAPQWLHVEATAYVGDAGRLGARLQADYDWLFTNRLILGARVEADAWTRDDDANDIGKGLSAASAGLRLRYEIRREIAPYLGVEWDWRFGETADMARDAGEDTRDTRFVAGLRFWF